MIGWILVAITAACVSWGIAYRRGHRRGYSDGAAAARTDALRGRGDMLRVVRP